jgi:signal peptidase I
MKSVLVALCGLVAPGFAHGLMSQRTMMWIIFASAYLAASAIALTVWASLLVVAIVIGSMVHAGWLHHRLRGRIRWSWLDPLLGFVAVVVVNITMRVFLVEAFKSPSTSMNPTLELGDHFFINKLSPSPSRGDIVVFRHPCQPHVDYVKRVVAVGGDTVEIRCTVVYVNGKPVARELLEDGSVCSYQDHRDDGMGRGGWHAVQCSRYRETLDDAVFEVFHDREQPARDGVASERGDIRDFPRDAITRSCANQDGPARDAPDQSPGKIVVTENAPTDRCKPFMHLVVPPDSVFTLGDNRSNSNDSRGWGVVPESYVKGRVSGRWFPIPRFGTIR